MKIGAIIQARVSSTRLPGKVLKQLPFAGGVTVLEQVVMRLKKSKKLDDIIVATTTEEDDNKIASLLKKKGIKCFRGSKENVLSRYYLAARENNLDIVVRVTSDCPCIDPAVVDYIIEKHIQSKKQKRFGKRTGRENLSGPRYPFQHSRRQEQKRQRAEKYKKRYSAHQNSN